MEALAWAAGVFDTGGSIYLNKRIQVRLHGPETVLRAWAKIMGLKRLTWKRSGWAAGKGRKTLHLYVHAKEIEGAFRMLEPYVQTPMVSAVLAIKEGRTKKEVRAIVSLVGEAIKTPSANG